MIKGMDLSEYFTDVAYKRLSAVEVDFTRSNQHEFNGIGGLEDMLGEDRLEFQAKLTYLAENSENPIVSDVQMTWYDSRENHPERSEHRLYYKANPVSEKMEEGDLMVIAKRPDREIYIFIAQKDSTYANQLISLFGIPETLGTQIKSRRIEAGTENIDFVKSLILEQIGIENLRTDENYLDALIEKFGMKFPTTQEFSDFARSTLPTPDVKSNPDGTLVAWMEREELLFRTMERYLMTEKIKGINGDVDEFIRLSLSMQNRRKSRAGFALENHLEKIFSDLDVKFSRGQKTENRSKPDFIFPGISEYRDSSFPENRLFMLGSKSTCKDRWRQVLTEAKRIRNKHLFTLEPAISTNQTNEMKANSLSLVLPESVHSTYTEDQRNWLLSLSDFINLVR